MSSFPSSGLTGKFWGLYLGAKLLKKIGKGWSVQNSLEVPGGGFVLIQNVRQKRELGGYNSQKKKNSPETPKSLDKKGENLGKRVPRERRV